MNHFVLINNQGLSSFGGGVTILEHLVNDLASNHRVTVISETKPLEGLMPNIQQYTIPKPPQPRMGLWRIQPLLKAFYLSNQLEKVLPKEYDCLIVLDCHYVLALGAVKSPINYISLSCIPRQEWFSGSQNFLQRVLYFLQYAFLERKIIKLAKKVFVSSNGHKREIVCYEKLADFSPVVLEPVFKTHPINEVRKVKKKYQPIVITTISRLELVKNIDAVINLAERLFDQNCYFRIVGDGPEKQRLEELIKQRGLAHKVALVGASNNINQVLMNTDILFHPSHYESFGMVVFEAMCMEVPVVISDNRQSGLMGIAEYIDDGVSGYNIDMEDMNNVEAIMLKLIESSERRVKVGKAGAVVAKQLLDKEYFSGLYEELECKNDRRQ